MKLPLALKNQLEESEEKYRMLLERLGWGRDDMEKAARQAERLRPISRTNKAIGETAGCARGRIYHV